MEFDQIIRQRHSVREYLNVPPSDGDLERILEAAQTAPSAGGLKSWAALIITAPDTRKSLAHAALDQMFIADAPVVIVFCADLDRIAEYGDRGKELYCIQDTSAAIMNTLLKATDLGLGSCWIGAFEEDVVTSICNLPHWLRPIALVTIGYEK
jgi:nitroreductase